MSVELVLEDLKKRYGDRKVLYASDIAAIIGESLAGTQRLLRTRSLPFPVVNVGRHCGVSLYAVALWLAECDSHEVGASQVPSTLPGKAQKRADQTRASVSTAGDCHDPESKGQASGDSLVAQIMAMRHDAARFISDQLTQQNHLPRQHMKYWRSVVKHLMFAPIASPSWVLRVVRATSLHEQNTMQRVYDPDGLEYALSDSAAYFSDDDAGVFHLTVRDSKTRKTVLEVMGQGRHQYVMIDEVGFSAIASVSSVLRSSLKF